MRIILLSALILISILVGRASKSFPAEVWCDISERNFEPGDAIGVTWNTSCHADSWDGATIKVILVD
jgi:hypothetical protein